MKSKGSIIFLNKKFGFIQLEKDTVYFNTKCLNDDYAKTISLLDVVFIHYEKNTRKGKHFGKLTATKVEFLQKGHYHDYLLVFGRLKKWNGKFGFIETEQLEKKEVFIYHTRFINSEKKLREGDAIIFNPVKSNKNIQQYFALFAYPIDNEKDIDWLIKKYKESFDEILKSHIVNLCKNSETDEKRNLELKILFENLSYTEIKKTLKKLNEIAPNRIPSVNYMKNKFTTSIIIKLWTTQLIKNNEDEEVIKYIDQLPVDEESKENYLHNTIRVTTDKVKKLEPKRTFEILKKIFKQEVLIKLWEDDVIGEYDINIMTKYFINESAANKRRIIAKINKEGQKTLLTKYFDLLKEKTTNSTFPTNHFKTLLDITFRNEDSRDIEVYDAIKTFLFEKLPHQDITDLWLENYLELPDNYIKSYFDFDDDYQVSKLLKKKLGKKDLFVNIIRKQYEQKFEELNEFNFEELYPVLVKKMMLYKEYFKEDTYINDALLSLPQDKKFILKIFSAPINFNSSTYLQNNLNHINDYYKIRFLITEKISLDEYEQRWKTILSISQEGLEASIKNFKWNNLIEPICLNKNDIDVIAYINDVKKYIDNYKDNKIDLSKLAYTIYEDIPKYKVPHIRLWLSELIDETEYSYLGFREGFKKLSIPEKRIFKHRLNQIVYDKEVVEVESNMVKPAKNVESKDNNINEYEAYIENFYFGNGVFSLRKKNGDFTKNKKCEIVSATFNSIRSSDPLNKIKIIVKVNEQNEIIEIDGLDEVIDNIHIQNIKKPLAKKSSIQTKRKSNIVYVKDWELTKKIIDYLNNNQEDSIKLEYVKEHKSSFGRTKKGISIMSHSTVTLYTIKTKDGYAIISENTDKDEDKATYVFKTSEENRVKQMNIIKETIASYRHLRKTLISKKYLEKTQELRDALGFVKTIRKQRGKAEAFDNWKKNFEKALLIPVPSPPSRDINDILDEWELLPSIGSLSPKIKPKKLDDQVTTLDIFEREVFLKENGSVEEESINRYQEVLDILQRFNHKFLHDLVINEKVSMDRNQEILDVLINFNSSLNNLKTNEK